MCICNIGICDIYARCMIYIIYGHVYSLSCLECKEQESLSGGFCAMQIESEYGKQKINEHTLQLLRQPHLFSTACICKALGKECMLPKLIICFFKMQIHNKDFPLKDYKYLKFIILNISISNRGSI